MKRSRSSYPPASRHAALGALVLACGVAAGACSSAPNGSLSEPVAVAEGAISGVSGPTTVDTPIGLALDVDGGVGTPLKVRAGQTFFINQIDVRTSIDAGVDEGVDGLRTSGDFTDVAWDGVKFIEEEPILLSNADGTYTRRRFFREARWMDGQGAFMVEQVDASGHAVAPPVTVLTGFQEKSSPSDDFWVRRFRAIQWTYDCVGLHDCTGAKSFSEEALVELRNAMHPERDTFKMRPETVALRMRWTQKPNAPWTIPVTQVAQPKYDYGFSIDVVPLTPPLADGTYAPGSDVTMQLTLRDGSGNRLHPPGEMPSYDEVNFTGPENAPSESGITYYRAFFDESTTYYRRKHRERNFIAQIVGPAQDIQPMRTIAPLSLFLTTEVHTVATPSVDGVHGEMRLFPPSPDLFGGAFDPTHAGWAKKVSDTWSWHLPPDAKPGTYYVSVKARRVYMGQDIPFTRTISIQVGTPTRTYPKQTIKGCNDCHAGNSSLAVVNHANPNVHACNACHVPLGFELEGPIYVRAHFLHSRSGRYDQPLSKCSTCHVDASTIQRTSKSACLSCHRSYPDSHVKKFGPIESMFIGGGAESFQQCSTTCHTEHTGSGFASRVREHEPEHDGDGASL